MAIRGGKVIGAVEPSRPLLAYLYSRLPFLLQRVDQIADALFAIETGDLRITPLQFQFLALLHDAGAAAQVDIARLAGIDTSTTSLVLGNLIKRHLVQRAADPNDRRRKIVTITDQGRTLLDPVARAHRRMQRRLFQPLGGDGPALMAALETMVASPSAAPRWAPPEIDDFAPQGCDAPHFASLSFLIRRCLQQTEANMAGQIGPHGLTIRQYAALLVICFHAGIGESGLTRLLGYESSNAALVVRLLVAKGMIDSDALRERGRRRYRATSLGISTMAAIEPGMTRAEVSLVAGMDGAAITRLQKMLGTIVATLDPLMRSPLALFSDIVSTPSWPTPLQPHLSVDISLKPPPSG